MGPPRERVHGVRPGASPPACGPRGRYGVHATGRLGRSWGPPAHRPKSRPPPLLRCTEGRGEGSGCIFGAGRDLSPSPGCTEPTRRRYDLHSPTRPEKHLNQHELNLGGRLGKCRPRATFSARIGITRREPFFRKRDRVEPPRLATKRLRDLGARKTCGALPEAIFPLPFSHAPAPPLRFGGDPAGG